MATMVLPASGVPAVVTATAALLLRTLSLPESDASLTDLLLNGTRLLSQAGVRNLYL